MSSDAQKQAAVERARAAVASVVGPRFIAAFQEAFPDGRLYLVGGAVRDFLLGVSTKDIDLLASRVPFAELESFLRSLGRVDFVGRTFGVLKFVPKGRRLSEPVDIALPRTERPLAGTGAYRDFAIASDPNLPVESDLARRDFTINAMALELPDGVLIDPFGGLGDLRASRLRAVGNPQDRFREDYSRMLRGIRFACRLGFSFETESWEALASLSHRIDDRLEDGECVVPREIVARELILAFDADPVRALDLLNTSGLLNVLIPELVALKNCPQPKNFHSEGDVWTHTRLALERLGSEAFRKLAGRSKPSAEVIFGVLFHDIAKPATIRTPERDGTDRIRFNEHDRVGGEMTRRISERLKLSQFPKDSPYHLDGGRLSWLVEKHLLLINDVTAMKNATIEKYFFNPILPGRALLKVILADLLATIPGTGEPDLQNYRALLKRIRELRAHSRNRNALAPPLLDGREVMRLLGLSPGPRVGRLLLELREAQLGGKIATREDAAAYLKSLAEKR